MLKFILIVTFLTFAYAFVGCASGQDGWNQACANANTALQSSYTLLTGEEKSAEEKGTAKSLLGCFENFDAALHAAEKEKNDACTLSTAQGNFNTYAGKVQNLITTVSAATANWKTCSLKALAANTTGGK